MKNDMENSRVFHVIFQNKYLSFFQTSFFASSAVNGSIIAKNSLPICFSATVVVSSASKCPLYVNSLVSSCRILFGVRITGVKNMEVSPDPLNQESLQVNNNLRLRLGGRGVSCDLPILLSFLYTIFVRVRVNVPLFSRLMARGGSRGGVEGVATDPPPL